MILPVAVVLDCYFCPTACCRSSRKLYVLVGVKQKEQFCWTEQRFCPSLLCWIVTSVQRLAVEVVGNYTCLSAWSGRNNFVGRNNDFVRRLIGLPRCFWIQRQSVLGWLDCRGAIGFNWTVLRRQYNRDSRWCWFDVSRLCIDSYTAHCKLCSEF